jgi:NhaP-type Na+/H+ and K+/H+ antiporter
MLAVAIIRDNQVLVPRGRTKLEENDVFLVLLESEQMGNKLRKILGVFDEGQPVKEA